MTTEQIKNIITRAAWTFVQAAAAVLAVTDQPFSRAGAVAAAAAGISAVKSYVLTVLANK